MGFSNKIIVIIDVGTDDDTSYLYLVRELKRDVFTHLHLSFFIIWLIALRWAKICYCFVHKYTLSITNSTITNNTIVGIYIYKCNLLVIAKQHMKQATLNTTLWILI